MKCYTFFCIQSNNDPMHFTIEYTSMQNARLRYSALKSQHKSFLTSKTKSMAYKNVFDYLTCDHTFFVIDKFRVDSPEDAQEIKKKLTAEREAQMAKCKVQPQAFGWITWD